jgi:hypothetical protein
VGTSFPCRNIGASGIKAARSNLRFQDRRIADLEARLTESASQTDPSIINPKRAQALSNEKPDLTSNQL